MKKTANTFRHYIHMKGWNIFQVQENRSRSQLFLQIKTNIISQSNRNLLKLYAHTRTHALKKEKRKRKDEGRSTKIAFVCLKTVSLSKHRTFIKLKISFNCFQRSQINCIVTLTLPSYSEWSTNKTLNSHKLQFHCMWNRKSSKSFK